MKFTIRDLLWLTAVAGLGVGWWLDHQQVARLEAEASATEIGMAMMAERLEFLTDENIELSIKAGVPVMIPIYSEDPPKVRQLVDVTPDRSPSAKDLPSNDRIRP